MQSRKELRKELMKARKAVRTADKLQRLLCKGTIIIPKQEGSGNEVLTMREVSRSLHLTLNDVYGLIERGELGVMNGKISVSSISKYLTRLLSELPW